MTMVFLSLFLFSMLRASFITGAPSESINIHHLLKRELRELYNVTLKDDAYDILLFWHRNGTSDNENGKELRFKRSGENVILTMKETSIIRWDTPIWVLEASDHLTQVYEAIDETITFYDSSPPSRYYDGPSLPNTIAHGTDKWGNEYFIGRLGDKYLVPISKEIATALRADKPHLFKEKLEPESVDEFGEFKLSSPHLIYSPEKSMNGKIKLVPSEQNDNFRKSEKSSNRTSYDRRKRSSADIIYPEILLVFAFDQDFPSVQNFQFLRLIMYIISFWNNVNLYFRSLEHPEVSLRIVGIIIVKGVGSASFLKENLNSDSKLNVKEVIYKLPKWVISRISIPWDAVVLQTSAEFYYPDDPSGILGLAYVGIRCSSQKTSSAIFHDEMDYSGIATAVHEIGHLLGASHDGNTSPEKCSWTEGYIMTPYATAFQILEWSQCSKYNISSHLRNHAGDCFDNNTPRGDQGELLDTMYLPGGWRDSQKQCEDQGYASVGESSNVCENLRCCTFFCYDTGYALDGTACPLGICLYGKCVTVVQQ